MSRTRAVPPLMLISDAGRVGMERFLAVLTAAWRAGLPLLQVREPDPEVALQAMLELERPPTSRIFINRRADLCARYSLDGVHVGGGRPEAVGAARDLVGERVVGYSAHSEGEVFEAARYGADYVTYSPIFGALSKRHPLPPLGVDGLERLCAASPVPVVALGAVTPRRVAEVRRAGAAGVAVIGAIVDADRPGAVVRDFLRAWEMSSG